LVMAAKNFHRRSIRFKGRDYTAPGIYFVTICSADGSNIFGRVNDGTVVENRLGQLVRARWLEIPRHFANVELDAFVVMPNHVHGLIHLRKTGAPAVDRFAASPSKERQEEFRKPVPTSLATVVRTFKAAVTRDARRILSKPGKALWQRSYYERVVRDGKEYADTYRYICENPMRWDADMENLAIKRAHRG